MVLVADLVLTDVAQDEADSDLLKVSLKMKEWQLNCLKWGANAPFFYYCFRINGISKISNKFYARILLLIL